jgi:hypothetical protein
MEAMKVGSARRKKYAGFSLDDEDRRLLAKYPLSMPLEEVEESFLKNFTPEEADVEGIEEVELPSLQSIEEDDSEPEELPSFPPDGPPPEDEEPIEEPDPEDVITDVIKPSHPLEDPSIGAAQLLKYLTDEWKSEWISWEPETIFSEVEKTYNVTLPGQVQEKILALDLLHSSDSFWQDWQVFQIVTVTFGGRQARFDDVQELSLAEIDASMRMAASLSMMSRNEAKTPYSDEVLGYIAATASNAGLVYLPPPMNEAQEYLDTLSGAKDLAPQVAEEWARMMALDPALARVMPIEETPVGVQIARLLALKDASDDILGV